MTTRILSFMASAVATVALLTGCSTENDLENGKDGLASLELSSVSSSDMLTRAVIDGKEFPTDKGNIGLFLYANEDASEKYGDGYENVQYSYNSTKSKWTASPSIKVGSDPGYLFGYYPYISTATDVKAIPVASSLNGDDVMYAEKVSNVTDATAANTSIKMNHALARVCITVVNKGYTGNAKLSKIKFSGAEIAPEGTLNAIDGSVTATKSEVTLDVTGDAQTITAAGTTHECLLVPSKVISDKQKVALTLTIDDKDMTATLSGDNGVIIAQGTKSTIVLNIKDNKLEVVSVGVAPWTDTNVTGNTARAGDYTVTFNCPEGLRYNINSESISTIIPEETTQAGDIKTVIFHYDRTSVPESRFVFNKEVSNCTIVQDWLSDVITVTDITGNVTVNLGYGTYIPYTAREKVIPNKTDAFGAPYDDDRSTFDADSKSGVVAIAGTVTKIGNDAFAYDTKLTSVTIQEGVVEIGQSAFRQCTNLAFPQFPESLTTIGNSAFYKAGTGVPGETVSLTFGSKLQTIGESAFAGCSKLTSVTFSKGLTTIGNSAFDACDKLTDINFEDCTKLKTIGVQAFYGAGNESESSAFSLVLPEGLESIGGSAFASAKISSVTLPSTLTTIGYAGFYDCSNLASITSNASVPPTLGENAFYYYNKSSHEIIPMTSIEAIYVPEASVTAYKNADGWKEFSDKIAAIPAQD